MKSLYILLMLLSNFCAAQVKNNTDEEAVLKAALTDKSNFIIMEFADLYKIPKTKIVFSKPEKWNPNQFWLEGISDMTLDSTQLGRFISDEHHPYNHTYIFRSKTIDSLFSIQEQRYLYEQCQKVDTTTLFTLRTKGVQIIQSIAEAKPGFLIGVTWPLFTSDGKTALVNLTIYRKVKKPSLIDQLARRSYSIYGYNTVIYRKLSSGQWAKLDEVGHLIL